MAYKTSSTFFQHLCLLTTLSVPPQRLFKIDQTAMNINVLLY